MTGTIEPGNRQGGRCPHLEAPFPQCYCINMESTKTEAAVRHCGNDFENCDIFKRHTAG